MSKSRIKSKTIEPITSRVEAESEVGSIAKLKAQEQKITAQMNEEIERVRRNFAPDLTDLNTKLEAKFLRVQEWAEGNPEVFAKVRSITTPHGTLGFRLGNHAARTIKGWTWDRVIEKVLEFKALLSVKAEANEAVDPASFEARIPQYLGYSVDFKKAALITDRETFEASALLRIGLKIEQAESFYIEPKIETVETRVTQETA